MGMAPIPGLQIEGAGPSSAALPSASFTESDLPSALFSAGSSVHSSASVSPESFTHGAARFGRPAGGLATQLSGPGIPGPSTEPVLIGPAPRGRSIGPRTRRGSVRLPSSRYADPYPRASTSGDSLDAHRLTPRPARSLPPANVPLREEDEFPITLPPLLLSRSPSPETSQAMGSGAGWRPRVRSPLGSSHGAGPSGLHLQSFSDLESPFAHQSPGLNIPPPFTLQPPPLWDDPAFSPYNPPGPSSRPGSSYRTSISHTLSRSQAPPPTPFGSGFTTTTSPTSPTALPSLTNLFHEGVAGPHSNVTLAPIRTRFDVVRQAVSPRETTLPQSSPTTRLPPRQGASAAPSGPSRSRGDDELEDWRVVHQPPPPPR
ncbi:hypothetical protein EIP91_003331 [Steccherinum ochraceum]|uniref:Uncharacterized protein n=1 Tax=Steccherinum ochraceum TaxID=92696 RepID=A0A4R0RAN4_9APHY|nr:hypothetical protein EIP91_003331 [Steccherinum ochraceum]